MKKFITIDPRLYDYVRKNSMKGIDESLVELITNSIDAYRNTTLRKIVNIKIDTEFKTVDVTDHAIGLDAENMKKCFLCVGKYTNISKNNRGHFSRGAKDISALGDIYYTCIKNNMISRCVLYHDCSYEIFQENEKCTLYDREKYNIKNNGLMVQIKLKNYDLVNWNKNKFTYYYSLRNILSDKSNFIFLNFNGFEERLCYKFPNGKLLTKIIYTIPLYQTQAELQLYEVNEENNFYKDEENIKYSENAIIIYGDENIYDCTLINNTIERNMYSNKIYGTIKCNHLKELLNDFDKNGSSEYNPFPIIDPSRINGINHKHPFCGHLFDIPIKRLKYIFLMKEQIDKKKINNKLNEFMELQFIGGNIFNKIRTNFLDEKNIVKAINKNQSINSIIKKSKTRENIIEDHDIFEKFSFNFYKKNEHKKVYINFVNNYSFSKFDVNISNNNIININISLKHPALKLYMNPDGIDNAKYINKPEVKTIIAEIITESIVELLVKNEIKKMDKENKTSLEIYNDIEKVKRKYYNSYVQKIYNIIFNNN